MDDSTLAPLDGSSHIELTLPSAIRRKRKMPENQFSEVSIAAQHLADSEVSVCENYSHSESTMVPTFVDAGIDSISGLHEHIDFIVNADGYWKMEKLQQEF